MRVPRDGPAERVKSVTGTHTALQESRLQRTTIRTPHCKSHGYNVPQYAHRIARVTITTYYDTHTALQEPRLQRTTIRIPHCKSHDYNVLRYAHRIARATVTTYHNTHTALQESRLQRTTILDV
ncbi:hypothetical protein J6590_070092 [Homalodisca vitripennis]|nr:hypothetical protein J6590_070092 [Homalodisca vitripennis]